MSDSIQKSAVVGRTATGWSQVIAAVIMAKWGIDIDAETQQMVINESYAIYSGILFLYGWVTSIISKIRENKVCK